MESYFGTVRFSVLIFSLQSELFKFSGHNPVDIAQSWADPRVLGCVQTKWDSLPPVGGKGGKGKGGKGGKSTPKQRPQSVPVGDGDKQPPGTARVRILSYLLIMSGILIYHEKLDILDDLITFTRRIVVSVGFL